MIIYNFIKKMNENKLLLDNLNLFLILFIFLKFNFLNNYIFFIEKN